MTDVRPPIVVMERYELKYIVAQDQAEFFLHGVGERLLPDRYGLTTIASLYYDTPDRRLIRASLEKPKFKEKIRLRSYGPATDDSPVFLEMKRKCSGIVYKRRMQTTVPQAARFFSGADGGDSQIAREIGYFRDFYGSLAPSCLIFCDRTAFVAPGNDIRATLDANPRFRSDDLDLRSPVRGEPLLPPGYLVLELKTEQVLPFWMAKLLSEGAIYQTSFSKYGEAYRSIMTGCGTRPPAYGRRYPAAAFPDFSTDKKGP